MKKHWQTLLEILFFAVIFVLSITPLRDFDIWFHLKSGEIFTKMGIIHRDVFSFNTQGRELFPYEWLFQVFVYFIQQAFSFEAIKYFIATVATLQIWVFYRLIRKLLNLNIFLSFISIFFFYAYVFEFYNARPHILAYTFLIINLYLMLLYYFKGKNLLWITLPITLMWANLHGSIFLDVGLFGAYAVISLFNFFSLKNPEWKKKAKTFSLYTVITAILTILPPLGTTQYRLLWTFYQYRDLITKFIDEWTPLSERPIDFWLYTTTLILIFIYAIFVIIKKKNWRESLWLLPILPFAFLPYTANRNVFLGNITLVLILAWCLSFLNFKAQSKKIKLAFVSILALVIAVSIFLLFVKKQTFKLYYPIKATQFIKKYNLSGRMFNEFGYGGYLLYFLYPEHKVFIDGRTDIYLCCEMKDVIDIADHKFDSDNNFQQYLYHKIWNKYDISYVLMRTEKHTLLRKIARVLSDDPQWMLVFWDDYAQIFVRRDGKNDKIIKEFGANYATPYLKTPFKSGHADQTYLEYLRMDKVAKSARTSNTIGYIMLSKNNIGEAEKRFREAIKLDPTFESPYMNLGEIAAKNGDYQTAIELYKQAQKLAVDRGLIYIRLGQLYIEGYQDKNKAKEIWNLGLKLTVDEDAKKTLSNLLEIN